MLNILTFSIGILAIFLIAKYNKSNKLFWSLLFCMLSGFVGGSICSHMANGKKETTVITQPNSMQMTPISTAMFEDNNVTLVASSTKSASQFSTVSDVINSNDSLTGVYESDVGNKKNEYNTS